MDLRRPLRVLRGRAYNLWGKGGSWVKRGYRILALALLLLGLLPAACLAADGQTLEEIMSQFQED